MDNKELPFGAPPQHHNANINPPKMVPDGSTSAPFVPTPEDLKINLQANTTAPNYMTLPGTPSKPFEVFFQFDDSEPIRMAETRGKFTIELSPYDYHGGLTNSDEPLPGLEWHEGGKKFKIFLKRKP